MKNKFFFILLFLVIPCLGMNVEGIPQARKKQPECFHNKKYQITQEYLDQALGSIEDQSLAEKLSPKLRKFLNQEFCIARWSIAVTEAYMEVIKNDSYLETANMKDNPIQKILSRL